MGVEAGPAFLKVGLSCEMAVQFVRCVCSYDGLLTGVQAVPRWICPYCTHLSTIDAIIVGHEFSCPSCKIESTVVDADAESIARLRSEKAAGDAASSGLRSVTISTVVLGIVFALGLLASFGLIATGARGNGLNLLFLVVLSACLISPLFDAFNEIHRCRRLLEELVKKK